MRFGEETVKKGNEIKGNSQDSDLGNCVNESYIKREKKHI